MVQENRRKTDIHGNLVLPYTLLFRQPAWLNQNQSSVYARAQFLVSFRLPFFPFRLCLSLCSFPFACRNIQFVYTFDDDGLMEEREKKENRNAWHIELSMPFVKTNESNEEKISNFLSPFICLWESFLSIFFHQFPHFCWLSFFPSVALCVIQIENLYVSFSLFSWWKRQICFDSMEIYGFATHSKYQTTLEYAKRVHKYLYMNLDSIIICSLIFSLSSLIRARTWNSHCNSSCITTENFYRLTGIQMSFFYLFSHTHTKTHEASFYSIVMPSASSSYCWHHH